MFPSDTNYETKVTLETNSSALSDDQPFHLLVLGDWSGQKSSVSDSGISELQPIEIDRDNFDQVLSKFDVSVDLAFPDSDDNTLSLRFTALDDFHPDSIFQKLPLFSDLRSIRRDLLSSNAYHRAAQEVKSWFDNTKTIQVSGVEAKDVPREDFQSSSVNLLDQILNQSDQNDEILQSQSSHIPELSVFIKEIVKPHLIQIDTAEQSELLMIVDEMVSDLMRRILHHPKFQALESAWRGAYFLVKRIETSAKLKIYLLDLNKDQLVADLKLADTPESSFLHTLLSHNQDRNGDYISWGAICGNYTFSLDVDDAATLIRISEVASKNDLPFISYIKPQIFGFNSFETVDFSDAWKVAESSSEDKLWTTLRVMPESAYLALALSRTLARLPYGEKTEPTESFYFAEFTSLIPHENYLWLNPAFAIALLLSQTFQEYGWSISENLFQDIEGLPFHLSQQDGETKIKSSAEVTMSQSNYETVVEQGFIPLISYKNADKVKIDRFQSIAYPPLILKGKWS